MLTPTSIPKPVVPTAETPYDPKVGPVIRAEHWTPEMLAAPLTQSLLANQVNPAGFLAARLAPIQAPTPAAVITEWAGRVHSIDPMNPETLSTAEQATAMYAHLIGLGMSTSFGVDETPLGGTGHRYEWADETRRQYQIGSLNVGQLARRYATTLYTLADQQTIAELTAAGMMR